MAEERVKRFPFQGRFTPNDILANHSFSLGFDAGFGHVVTAPGRSAITTRRRLRVPGTATPDKGRHEDYAESTVNPHISPPFHYARRSARWGVLPAAGST